MRIAPVLLLHLRSNLLSLLGGAQSEQQINQLIAVSHSLAVAYIGHRISTHSFTTALVPLSAEDIAYDCIADLFERDEWGNYLRLQAYFKGIQIGLESDESLLIHLRRLTFSNVNHGITRIYNDADPSLGRVLRTINGAVAALNNFQHSEEFGETYLTPSCCDPLRHLPMMEHAVFDEHFGAEASCLRNVPALLGQLSLFLRHQQEYRRSVPIVSAALVFRNIFARQDEERIPAPSPTGTDGQQG